MRLRCGSACVFDAGGSDAGGSDAGGFDASDAPAAPPGKPPPPITGGTLIVTRDGRRAVAADPDLDRVAIAGISTDIPGCDACDVTPKLLAKVDLEQGEEPGRIAEDREGRVHVVLRRGGAVATIDVANGELLARRPVCGAPRGIAYDEASNLVHVACASGELVSLPPHGGDVQRRIDIDVDLRDVVVVPGGLVVSRFKSAELIRLDTAGNIVARIAPTRIERGPQDLTNLQNDPMEPAVAWRTVGTSTGGIFMLHQYGLARPIKIGGMGSPAPPTPYLAQAGSQCSGIVAQTVSTLTPDGAFDMGMPMPVRALSVDVAVSTDGAWLVVAHPGSTDVDDKVTIYDVSALPSHGRTPVRCADNAGRVLTGQAVAVALYPDRIPTASTQYPWLVVQQRNPSALSFYNAFGSARSYLKIGDDRSPVPGHDLFHLDSGGGIACAQCHAEAAEDGRVWAFEPEGRRRTQALNVGLEGTEPFHWGGNLADLKELVDEVFVRRMGGHLPPNGIADLKKWLGSLSPPKPIVDPDAPEAARGRSVFELAGCPECHAGPAVAKTANVDVGVESPGEFQVPALRGVGYRAPFLHNGCAKTLRDRFDPACGGGDKHGKTSQLSPAELDDLIAYLRSL